MSDHVYDHIQVSVEAGIGRVLLDRPEVLNALIPEMLGELIEALDRLEQDSAVRCLLLSGAGRGFSAGGDASFLQGMTESRPQQIKDTVYAYFGRGVQRLKLFPKPTVAAVNGAAVGAGFELALACDFRIAASEALFYQSWIDLGLITPLGGMSLLPRLVGLSLAHEILMLGRKVGGEEAAEIGLVNRTVGGDQLMAEAGALAARLAVGPPLALRAMKEGIRRGMEASLAQEWEHNVYVQSLLIDSDDYAEGVAALAAGRRPEFHGR